MAQSTAPPRPLPATDDVILGEMDRGESKRIFISRREFKGTRYISVREFYLGKVEGAPSWLPTRKGLMVPEDEFGELVAAMKKADELP